MHSQLSTVVLTVLVQNLAFILRSIIGFIDNDCALYYWLLLTATEEMH